MTYQIINSTCAISSLILVSCLTFNNSAAANETTFVCLNQNGVPTTVVRNPRGDFPIIRWISTLGNGEYPPQKRCDLVSQKFQKFYDQKILKFLTTGRENGEKVICVAETEGGSCRETLYTLKPNDDPNEALQRLLNIRTRGSSDMIIETNSRVYIDMNQFLRETMSEAINLNSSQSPDNSINNAANPVNNSQSSPELPLWE